MQLKTFDTKKQKMVSAGELIDGVFSKKVNNSHYMVKEKGYGISQDILGRLIQEKVRKIIIHAKQTSYSTSLATWLARGKLRDYGHGKQVFLETSFMEKL